MKTKDFRRIENLLTLHNIRYRYLYDDELSIIKKDIACLEQMILNGDSHESYCKEVLAFPLASIHVFDKYSSLTGTNETIKAVINEFKCKLELVSTMRVNDAGVLIRKLVEDLPEDITVRSILLDLSYANPISTKFIRSCIRGSKEDFFQLLNSHPELYEPVETILVYLLKYQIRRLVPDDQIKDIQISMRTVLSLEKLYHRTIRESDRYKVTGEAVIEEDYSPFKITPTPALPTTANDDLVSHLDSSV